MASPTFNPPKANVKTFFTALRNTPGAAVNGLKKGFESVGSWTNKSGGAAGSESAGGAPQKPAKMKHNLPIIVSDYLGVFPVTQQIVGVGGILYNVGWLAAFGIVKRLNSEVGLPSHEHGKQLKHSVLRTIPVIGTLFSLKRFENTKSPVVWKGIHSDIGDSVADVFSILPIVQQVVGAGGMLWNIAKLVGNVVKRIFYRNDAYKTPWLKESAERHKAKIFVNLLRFTPLIGTVFSIQRATVNFRNK